MRQHRFDMQSFLFLAALVIADLVCWRQMIFALPAAGSALPRADFLDVGQGDAELMLFPGNIKVMTDAGPDGAVIAGLETALGAGDRYIDVAIITHPQSDHYGGFSYVLDHYNIGAFIYNGRNDSPGVASWPALLAKIKAKHIPLITLGKDDVIHIGTDSKNGNIGIGEIDLLSPDKVFAESGELNDTGLVELVKTPQFRTLLTADTGFNVQDALVTQGVSLRADILKVGHHGSKYSTDDLFLRAVDPKIAVIEVGAKNTYGHPAKETLARIAASTVAAIVRTDRDGTTEIWRDAGVLHMKKEK